MADNPSDNHGLDRPSKGDADWHTPLNDNFDILEVATPIVDTDSNRSSYTPKTDALYVTWDNGEVYRGDGNSWDIIGTIGSGSSTSEVNRFVHIPLTDIPDGESAVAWRGRVPSGETLLVDEVGVQNDSGSAPTGLDIVVRNVTGAADIDRENTQHSGSLSSASGQIDVEVRVENSTGSTQTASGHALFRIE